MEFFYDVLNEYIEKTQLTPGRLAKLTHLSRQTIASWRQGRVKRPRLASDILSIAKAMRLTVKETDRLLLSADYDPLHILREKADKLQDGTLHDYLEFWAEEEKPVALPSPPPLKAPFQAPSKIGDFVGREAEIEQISQTLQVGGAICVLQGMGGVGKSTLANYLAYTLRPHFTDGVLWATFKDEPLNETDMMTILRDFAKAYGVDVKDDVDLDSRSRTVRDLLSDKNVLLVFDNVYGTEDVRPLLPAADGNCSVVITTRNKRLLQDRAHAFDVNSFSHEDGLSLLKKIIKDDRVENEQAYALELIDFVGGLPLALRIIGSAIAEIETITLEEYSDLLKDEFSRLEYLEDWEDLSKNVRASFELSYQRLDSKQQELLNRISAFVGRDFSEDAILALASPLNPALVKLKYLSRFKSLSLIEFQVKVDNTENPPKKVASYQARYRFHPLLRTFIREKLEEDTEEALQKQLAEYYAGFTQQYGKDTYSALDLDWENIEAAVHWSQENKWNETLVQLTDGATQLNLGSLGFLDAYGHWREGTQWLAWCLDIPDVAENERLMALCHLKQGTFAFHLADLAFAEDVLQKSLDALDDSQDEEAAIYHAYACDILSRLDSANGIEYALDWSERGIERISAFDSADATHLRGYMLVRRSSIWGRAGDINAAHATVVDGLALLPERSTIARVSAYTNLGAVAYFKDDHDEARRYWELAVKDVENLGDSRRLVDLWNNLGTIYSLQGDFVRSVQQFDKAKSLSSQIGYVRGECQALTSAANDMRRSGREEEAENYLDLSLSKIENSQSEIQEIQIYVHCIRARLQCYTENLSTADRDSTIALKLSQQRQLQRWTGVVISIQAEIALLKKQPDEAKRLIERALQINLDAQERGIALRILGDALVALEQFDDAMKQYAQCANLLENASTFEYMRTQSAIVRLKTDMGESVAVDDVTPILEAFKRMNATREIAKVEQLLAEITAL